MPPIITRETPVEEFVLWPTEEQMLFMGHMSGADPGRFTMKYRLTTTGDIASQPAFLLMNPESPVSGRVFVGSADGYVHALQEVSGLALWRFSTGKPILEPVVAIDGRVYAINQLGGMYCLDAQTGRQIWWTPNVIRWVSASKDRIYAIDHLGRMIALNAKNGGRLDTMHVVGLPIRLRNIQTDRIYLATEQGLIQCLHERSLPQPISHVVTPKFKFEEDALGSTGGTPRGGRRGCATGRGAWCGGRGAGRRGCSSRARPVCTGTGGRDGCGGCRTGSVRRAGRRS